MNVYRCECVNVPLGVRKRYLLGGIFLTVYVLIISRINQYSCNAIIDTVVVSVERKVWVYFGRFFKCIHRKIITLLPASFSDLR